MEKRRELRFQPNQNQDVTVNVLGLKPSAGIPASIIDISRTGMRLRSKLAIPCGALVQVAVTDTVAYGSVNRCEPERDEYLVGIQISETASVLKA